MFVCQFGVKVAGTSGDKQTPTNVTRGEGIEK